MLIEKSLYQNFVTCNFLRIYHNRYYKFNFNLYSSKKWIWCMERTAICFYKNVYLFPNTCCFSAFYSTKKIKIDSSFQGVSSDTLKLEMYIIFRLKNLMQSFEMWLNYHHHYHAYWILSIYLLIPFRI